METIISFSCVPPQIACRGASSRVVFVLERVREKEKEERGERMCVRERENENGNFIYYLFLVFAIKICYIP